MKGRVNKAKNRRYQKLTNIQRIFNGFRILTIERLRIDEKIISRQCSPTFVVTCLLITDTTHNRKIMINIPLNPEELGEAEEILKLQKLEASKLNEMILQKLFNDLPLPRLI